MYRTDNKNYKAREPMGSAFVRSCLGQFIIFAAIMLVLMIIASLTVPSEQEMDAKVTDDIRQWIESPDSIEGDKSSNDWIDNTVSNIGFTFTEAGPNPNEKLLQRYKKTNRLEQYEHTFFRTMYLYNNFSADGVRSSIGIFGMVIPLINYANFMPKEGVLQNNFNKPPKSTVIPDDYVGSNPHLKPYHYKGDPEN
jgi:hypothetical protein